MNLPNQLTSLRFILTLGFIYFVTRTGLFPAAMALLLFVSASITDFLDGYFAKKRNLISAFGKIMDPIADKFLILTAFFIFVDMHYIAAWMFYIIFFREIFVTGHRFLAMKKGKVLAAERAGKYKTCIQLFTITFILTFMILQEAGVTASWYERPNQFWVVGIYMLMLMTVTLTLYSGISYLWNNRKTKCLIN